MNVMVSKPQMAFGFTAALSDRATAMARVGDTTGEQLAGSVSAAISTVVPMAALAADGDLAGSDGAADRRAS